jgi:hypothetical protein
VAATSHRRALGALFLVLAIALVGVAWTALAADQWIIGGAAAVIAVWLAVMAIRALRP